MPSEMTPIQRLRRRRDDPRCLAALAAEAREFLQSHAWCKRIRRGFLGVGWDGIVGVFLFDFDPADGMPDNKVWVITGDVPSAYVCFDNPNGISALQGYIFEMRRWVRAVEAGRSTADLIPVDVRPTKTNAKALASRLKFLDENMIKPRKHELDSRRFDTRSKRRAR